MVGAEFLFHIEHRIMVSIYSLASLIYSNVLYNYIFILSVNNLGVKIATYPVVMY